MWILAADPSRIPCLLRAYYIRDPTESLLSLFIQRPERPDDHSKRHERFKRRLYVCAILSHFLVMAPLLGLTIAWASGISSGTVARGPWPVDWWTFCT